MAPLAFGMPLSSVPSRPSSVGIGLDQLPQSKEELAPAAGAGPAPGLKRFVCHFDCRSTSDLPASGIVASTLPVQGFTWPCSPPDP